MAGQEYDVVDEILNRLKSIEKRLRDLEQPVIGPTPRTNRNKYKPVENLDDCRCGTCNLRFKDMKEHVWHVCTHTQCPNRMWFNND